MPRFQYAFQKMVDLKSNEKVQAEWLLSRSVGRLREAEAELSRLELEKQRMQAEVLQDTRQKISVSHMQMIQTYIDHLSQKIEHKHEDVHHAEHQVSQNKQDLTGKMVDEKVWTTAKDKAFQKFTAAFLKKEQNEIDEMAAVRHEAKTLNPQL